MTAEEAQRLSRLLYEARESIEMWSDVVESRQGVPSTYTRDLVKRIDDYRAEHGWNRNGYGHEEAT